MKPLKGWDHLKLNKDAPLPKGKFLHAYKKGNLENIFIERVFNLC